MPEGQRPNPPAHTVHLAVSGTVDAKYPFANVFWVRNGNAQQPTHEDLLSLCGDFAVLYGLAFKNAMSSLTHITDIDGLYYGPVGADLGATKTFDVAGTGTSDALPPNCAMCISWQVQQHYKGGHPRTYLPGLRTDNLQDSAHFQAAIADEFAGTANDMINSVNGISHGALDDLHMGVVSFVLRKQWRQPPVFRDYVPGGASVDTRIDSMRRRLGR